MTLQEAAGLRKAGGRQQGAMCEVAAQGCPPFARFDQPGHQQPSNCQAGASWCRALNLTGTGL